MATEVENPLVTTLSERMDALGHFIHNPWVALELVRKRDFHVARRKEKEEEDPFPLELLLTEGVTCYNCGGYLSFQWTGNDEDTPVVHHQSAHRPPDDRRIRVIADDTQCSVPELLPVTIRFTCRSGRIALGNDFRTATGLDVKKKAEVFISINDYAGQVDYIKWFGEQNYCTGHVHGHIWFLRTEDGIEVRHSNDGGIDEEEWERLDEKALHHFSTELWWFAIIDAEDLPEGGTDSYDREPGFCDLKPGVYEFTTHPESSNGNIAGTLRRVEEP
jgi:hypothetical protein